MKIKLLLNIVVLLIFSCNKPSSEITSGKTLYVDFQRDLSELLDTVQLSGLYTDSKTFVDFPLKTSPDSIVTAFSKQINETGFVLKSFIATYFDTSSQSIQLYSTLPNHSIIQHIDTLWYVLTRYPKPQERSSLIPLNHCYVVPGGRFREVYYWDSYFTMLGLVENGHIHLIKSMVDNFSDLIATYGHIPNGNRTYYLSRSQPPFFASMVELLASVNDSIHLSDYLTSLVAEYQFWMKGKEQLNVDNPALYRTVWLDDSTILNRYWDNLCLPRPESYHEDVSLFRVSGRDSSIFRDIRAAAESGWDFSSRWFEDETSPETIVTTQIIPVDLNCLLYNLEKIITKAYLESGDSLRAKKYIEFANQRARAINRILWNNQDRFYHDYSYKNKEHTSIFSLAAMYPLFFQIADSIKAVNIKCKIENNFLHEYGVVTTLTQPSTKQQWDYPNGWAPLQWISYQGLENYAYHNLASEIAIRWMNINEQFFYGVGDSVQQGKMLEKYDVVNGIEGRGGEYPLQDGFGWTNGVYLKFYSLQTR